MTQIPSRSTPLRLEKYAMRLPSGEKAGPSSPRAASEVSHLRLAPCPFTSRSATPMLMFCRYVENTIRFPSDERERSASSPCPAVICCGSPPPEGTFQMLTVPPRPEEKYRNLSSCDQTGE